MPHLGWYRSRAQRNGSTVMLALCACVAVLAVFPLYSRLPFWDATFLLGLLGCVLAGIMRARRMGVLAHADGIVVANFTRTTAFGWDEIDAFSVGATAVVPRVLLVCLCAGGSVPAHGVQAKSVAFWPNDPGPERAAEALNDLLARYRGAGAVGGGE